MATPWRTFARGLTLSILMSVTGSASAAVTGTRAWAVQGPDGENPFIVLDSAGNVIESALYGTLVTKYNAAGQVVWSHQVATAITYMGTSGDLTGHMVVDSAGNIYVSTRNDDRVASPQLGILGLAKLSSSGTILWTQSIILAGSDGKSGGENMAVGPMALGTNGSLYVVGTSANFSNATAPVSIVRVDASTGAVQKNLPVTGPGTTDWGTNMSNSVLVLDSANNVYWGGPEGISSFASDLSVRWSNNQSAVRAVVLDASNNVYAAGYASNSSGGYDFIVKRLSNTNGAQVWGDQNFGEFETEPASRGFNALAIDSRSQLYAVGAPNINAQTIYKIDATTGNYVWFRGNNETDLAVALDANDNVYVAGTTAFGDPSGDGLLNVYDPQGNVLWSQTYNGPGNLNDAFTHVAVDNKGGVYLPSDTLVPGPPGSGLNPLTPEIVKYSESGLVFSGTYRVINRNSGKALDAVNQGTANGTQIDQWSYSGGNNQRWVVTSLGYNQYKVIGVQSGRSLDVTGNATANGTKVELWDYTAGNNQKYAFTATSGGYYRITPANATGSCIEGVGISTANGTLVDLWQYNGGNNQQWILQAP
jgi:Ricin-type beta-trefoil lectin domain-like